MGEPRSGPDQRADFTATCWTLVIEATGRAPSTPASEALEQLCRTYWYPLYAALEPFLAREAADGEYERLTGDLEMSKNALGVTVHRLRKRYGELIRAEVAHTVAQPLEIDDEMRYLHQVVSGS